MNSGRDMQGDDRPGWDAAVEDCPECGTDGRRSLMASVVEHTEDAVITFTLDGKITS